MEKRYNTRTFASSEVKEVKEVKANSLFVGVFLLEF
mgnify:CR=1 FL=1